MSAKPMISLPDFFQPVINPTYSDWVEKDCNGKIDKANAYIPLEFESYIHLCHPYWQYPDNCNTEAFLNLCQPEQGKLMLPVYWRDFARARQLPFDGTTGFSSIGWRMDYETPSPGDVSHPHEGVPTIEILQTIERAVAKTPQKDDICVCAFWGGFMHFKFPPTEALYDYGQGPYFLMQGPGEAVFAYWTEQIDKDCYSASSTSPQAIWSSHRDWFYVAPFENLSSLFGGPANITRDIVHSTQVEAYDLPDISRFRF